MSISLTLAVFKVNAGGESITSFEIENPTGMAEGFWNMPEANLYMVCIAKKKGALRSVKAGLAVLTSLTHHDPEFIDMLSATSRSNAILGPIIAKSGMSMLPAKLTFADGALPSEDELKGVFFEQFLKHSSSGSA